MEDEGGVLKAATRSNCTFAQPRLSCTVNVLHSAGFLPTLARAVFCKTHEDIVLLPLGFYSFYLQREGRRQGQGFGWRGHWQDVELLRLVRDTNTGPVTFSAGCGRFRLSLFDWKIIAAKSSSQRAKFLLFASAVQIKLCIQLHFLKQFFFLILKKTSHKYLEQAWKKSIKGPKFKFVLRKEDCVLDWGWVKGQTYCCYFAGGTGEGYCPNQKGRCGVTSEQK